MWNIVVITTFILAVTVPNWSADASCSEERMRDCEVGALKYLHSVEESRYDEFCEDLRNHIECPKMLPENCKKQFPGASHVYTIFMDRMHEWCNRSSADRRIWFKIGFCATKNPKDFHHCFKMRTIKNETGDQLDCEFYDFLYCMSAQVLQSCGEEREFLSKYIEDSVHESYPQYCVGSSGMINNHFILNLLGFLSLAFNYKILHKSL